LENNTIDVIERIAKKLSPENIGHIFGSKGLSRKDIDLQTTLSEIHKDGSETILILSCILDFMYRKNKAIAKTFEKEFSQNKEFRDINNVLTKVFLLYKKDQLLLREIYIRNISEQKKFSRYQLHSETKSQTDWDLSDLDSVNSLFKQIDEEMEDNLESRCWYTINDDDTDELYIRRQDAEKSWLPKLNENVSEMLAKSIIIKIREYGRSIDYWEQKGTGIEKEILRCICHKIFDTESEYLPLTEYNDREAVEKFLRVLIDGLDSELTLMKIDLKKTLLPNNPSISISSDIVEISSAIQELVNHGITLSDKFSNDTKSIKIKYVMDDGNTIESTVNVYNYDDTVLLYLPHIRGDIERYAPLSEYISKQHSVSISYGRE